MTRPTAKAVIAHFIAVVVILLLTDIGRADDSSPRHVTIQPPGAKHQLWLVSTRFASSCPSLQETARLKYWRCDPDYHWRSSDLGELLGSDDPEITTLVYVHENRVSRTESFYRVWKIFKKLSLVAPPGKRFRLIAISWPSDRIGRRPRPDVQIKADRSEAHGWYLAWLLDHINPDVPVALFGNSYGPRMITAALHFLGGGSINDCHLAERVHPDRRPVRLVLMAAALDVHWLYPGRRHGQALSQIEQLLITVNPTDRVLRLYPRMYGLLRGGPQALGYVGLPCGGCLRPNLAKVIEWNVSGQVGSTHSWTVYEGSSIMMAQIAPHLFAD